MKYKALIYFTDLTDNKHEYNPGDEFPRKGLKVSAERLDELSTNKNRRGKAVIELVEEPKDEPIEAPIEETAEKPKPKRTRKKKDAD